jgi:hypothetical protein
VRSTKAHLSRFTGREQFSGRRSFQVESWVVALDEPVSSSPEFIEEWVMEGQASTSPQVSPEAFVAAMRQETEEMLRQAMAAVNDAPDGAWINASEGPIRDLLGEYRRRVQEQALQMRADAAEGAFSPDRPANGSKAQKQRH